MGEAVIVSYARTPVTDAYRGSLANTSVVEWGKVAVAEALKRSGVAAEDVDDVILGEVLEGGGDLARYIALDLGLPPDTPGLAVQRQCGSGLAAVNAAAASIRAGIVKVADTDEHPRRDTSLEKLAALPSLPQSKGRITAGNSSSLNDAAAAMVVVDADYAQAHGLTPLAAVRSWAAAGVPPRDTGL